jgi:hypothetical protein
MKLLALAILLCALSSFAETGSAYPIDLCVCAQNADSILFGKVLRQDTIPLDLPSQGQDVKAAGYLRPEFKEKWLAKSGEQKAYLMLYTLQNTESFSKQANAWMRAPGDTVVIFHLLFDGEFLPKNQFFPRPTMMPNLAGNRIFFVKKLMDGTLFFNCASYKTEAPLPIDCQTHSQIRKERSLP